jgi:uncharacterized membrane protein
MGTNYLVNWLFLLVLAVVAILIVLSIVAVNIATGKKRKAGAVLVGGLVGGMVLVVLAVVSVGLLWGVSRVERQASYMDQPNRAMTDQTWDSRYGRWDENRKEQGRVEGRYTEAQRSDGQQADSRIERVRTPAEPAHANDAAPGITVAGTPWTSAVEEYQDFEADVYPSIESAAKALGRRVGKRLIQDATTADGTPSIYVWRDADGGDTQMPRGGLVVTRDVLEAVASGIRQKLDEPAYVSVERPASKDAITVGVAIQEISFTYPSNDNLRPSQTDAATGGIALRVHTPDGPFSVSTRFDQNTWVLDRAGFSKRFPKGDWLVAFSDGTHTTHDQARQDAIDLAAAALLPMAQARIGQMSASDQQHFKQKLQKDPDWLLGRIADELVSQDLIKDRFTQSFDRPYGTVWREAILVDAAPKRVEAIARSLVRGVDKQVAHQRTTWFSFAALAGLVFGTYLFLNMATKGYYVWALRLVAVAGLVAAGFVVTHLF